MRGDSREKIRNYRKRPLERSIRTEALLFFFLSPAFSPAKNWPYPSEVSGSARSPSGRDLCHFSKAITRAVARARVQIEKSTTMTSSGRGRKRKTEDRSGVREKGSEEREVGSQYEVKRCAKVRRQAVCCHDARI